MADTDKLRDIFQNLMIESSTQEKQKFSSKKSQLNSIIEQVKEILENNEINLNDARVIATLATFAENLSKII